MRALWCNDSQLHSGVQKITAKIVLLRCILICGFCSRGEESVTCICMDLLSSILQPDHSSLSPLLGPVHILSDKGDWSDYYVRRGRSVGYVITYVHHTTSAGPLDAVAPVASVGLVAQSMNRDLIAEPKVGLCWSHGIVICHSVDNCVCNALRSASGSCFREKSLCCVVVSVSFKLSRYTGVHRSL